MKNDIPMGSAMLIRVIPRFSVMKPAYLNTPSNNTSRIIARVSHSFGRDDFDMMRDNAQFAKIEASIMNMNIGSPHA